MWKARKKHAEDWYQKGYGCSPLMSVAQRFKVPVRVVRDVIEAQRTGPVLACHCGNPGTLRTDTFDEEIHGKIRKIVICDDCYNDRMGDI